MDRRESTLTMAKVAPALPDGWRALLVDPAARAGLAAAAAFVDAEGEAGKRIFPPRDAILRAFDLTPLDRVRVVILGQDPYHGAGQAHGLCFSVQPGVRPPPSLANIYKELASDLGLARPAHGFLEHWARQGVLLLNSVLTVEMALPGSHRGRGWEAVTDAAVRLVAARPDPVVFMLWGAHAQKKAELVEEPAGGRHLVLTAAHPSPLSARNGFFGCRHFSRANAFLKSHGVAPIDWSLPPAA